MKHIGRIKVIQDNEDVMDCICICPHCGNHVLYGNMFMIFGIYGCPICQDDLRYQIDHDQEHHYDDYVRRANNHEYEPYRYKGEEE